MIKLILELLAHNDAYNVSTEVEIAKGKYAIPRTFKESMEKIKRERKFKK